jgi:hypothetical protein
MVGLVAAAISSLVVTPIPLFIRILAAISSVAVCSLAIRRHALLHGSRSLVAIQPLPAGGCIVKTASGGEAAATVLPDSVAWSWMLLLRVALEGKRWPVSILVLRDSVAEEDWRRLSIWLRWLASERAA